MRLIELEGLERHLPSSPLSGAPDLTGGPRVVASGNHATPWPLLAAFDAAVREYRLFVLNAQPGVPDRDGVVLETPFVGAGMRRSHRLRYLPSRLSLFPSTSNFSLLPIRGVLRTSFAPFSFRFRLLSMDFTSWARHVTEAIKSTESKALFRLMQARIAAAMSS